MGASVMIFFFLPWLDRSPVKSIRYKGSIYKIALTIFVVSFLVLGLSRHADADQRADAASRRSAPSCTSCSSC